MTKTRQIVGKCIKDMTGKRGLVLDSALAPFDLVLEELTKDMLGKEIRIIVGEVE